jgi:hypothetical protein
VHVVHLVDAPHEALRSNFFNALPDAFTCDAFQMYGH